jgi:YD repeat-containing protein
MFFCRATIKTRTIFFLLTLIFSLCAESATTLTITPTTSYDGNYTLSWVGDGAGVSIAESIFDGEIIIGGSGTGSGSYTFTGKAPGYYEYFLYVHSRSGTKTRTSSVMVNVVPAKLGNPVINPNGGTYTGQTNVAISSTTLGSTIRYTTNGATVTSQSAQYNNLIPITKNTTVKAKAFLAGAQDSDEVSTTFYIKALPPTINPGSTTFAAPTNVTISANTANSIIRYTTNGSAVTASSTQYTGAIPISVNTTVRARAFVANMQDSDEVSATFPVRTAAPGFNPGTTTFTGPASISLVANESGSTIRYTTNGTSVTESSTVYSTPIPINRSTTIRAKAFKSGKHESAEVSASYTVNFGFTLPATSITGEFDITWGGVRTYAELWQFGSPADKLLYSGSTTSFRVSVTESGTYYYYMRDCYAYTNSPTSCNRFSEKQIVVTFPKLPTPTITPNGASFSAPTSVTLASSDSGATIRYTVNNTEVTNTSPVYSSPILISANTKIRARAFKSKMTASNEASADFSVLAKPPTIAPANGTNFISSGNVTLTTTESGATLRYTTDGSSVTASSPLYSQAIAIDKNTTVKARAFKTGMANSNEVSASFTVRVATPSISPNGATFKGSGSVSLVSSTSGTTIRYTTDGSVVTASSLLYSSPITIGVNTTLKAKAFKTGLLESGEASASFLVAVLPPTISPDGASFPGAGQVTLAPKTSGSTIRYTTNGSAVTASSTTYSVPIAINAKTTIKAKAFKNGMANSDEVSALFLAGTTGKVVSIKYTYDALGRLREVKENNTEKTKYKYDPAGNREVVTEAPMK